MGLEEYREFRLSLVDYLTTDLVGPESVDEVILDAPITKYVAGVLYPQSEDPLDPSLDVDLDDDESEEVSAADPPVAMSNVRYPSSMGLSFAIDVEKSTSILISVTAARYEAVESESEGLEGVTSDCASASDALKEDSDVEVIHRALGPVPPSAWGRRVETIEPLAIEVDFPRSERVPLVDGLSLFVRIRKTDGRGRVSISLVLINTNRAAAGELRDSRAFFQTGLVVETEREPAFVQRADRMMVADDPDLRSYELLYRHARNFAVGHGCSVDWDTSGEETASRIWTTFVPSFELRLSESNPEIVDESLGIKFLAESDRRKVLDGLRRITKEYETWIGTLRGEATTLPPELGETARIHIAACDVALGRIKRGIEHLASDDTSWTAFQLANQAMLTQRARATWVAGGMKAEPAEDGSHRWHPFQLAFFLLCLEGIANPETTDRDVADLLWFPTGGGKTEAYLGIIAFTVFLRRLRAEGGGGGVTAVMRYTLRLLTIQQFERAALLICCCESIRRRRDDLGDTPISLGLWVGQGGTPNLRKKAQVALDKLARGVELQSDNPVQLHGCPWCGTRLDYRNYKVKGDRVGVQCYGKGCAFGAGLPVFVVDEDIYDFRPTLIIGTVDKFAALPWQERVAEIFNVGTTDPPPELIIQDELHLISGPLGTLAGLYETAVDFLCARDGVRPKVIASTATIRRASSQATGLFDRPLNQFPPPGLDARNSYFATEALPDDRGTRMYVGLMAPGTSQTSLMVRSYAAVLQGAVDLPCPNESVRDPYYTLVGYFNSLRVLGGARMQVQDDVQDRLVLLAARDRAEPRKVEELIELTSREPSGNIPGHLKRMATALPQDGVLDVILATNMISVGVDIDRLGLMAVMGQPQSTSEYIQSTSRVGRKHPGLVLVLFNAARSRDLSHYESFSAFHSNIYRQVESTSVTPFSSRARDRALHAVLVALARLTIPALRGNKDAGNILRPDVTAAVTAVKERIIERVHRVAPDEEDAARVQLDEIIATWRERAEARKGLTYRDSRRPESALLTEAAEALEGGGDGFPTVWSLRDVDKSSNLYMVQGGRRP